MRTLKTRADYEDMARHGLASMAFVTNPIGMAVHHQWEARRHYRQARSARINDDYDADLWQETAASYAATARADIDS